MLSKDHKAYCLELNSILYSPIFLIFFWQHLVIVDFNDSTSVFYRFDWNHLPNFAYQKVSNQFNHHAQNLKNEKRAKNSFDFWHQQMKETDSMNKKLKKWNCHFRGVTCSMWNVRLLFCVNAHIKFTYKCSVKWIRERLIVWYILFDSYFSHAIVVFDNIVYCKTPPTLDWIIPFLAFNVLRFCLFLCLFPLRFTTWYKFHM